MANTRELRRRIKSVKNTSQITKAMQMVAATKMRRAQTQALGGRPYHGALSKALVKLLAQSKEEKHPLLSIKQNNKVGVLLLSTDKSLCGALNTNLIKTAQNFSQGKEVVFYTSGKKGRNFVVKTSKELVADFENSDTLNFQKAIQVSKLLSQAFLKNEVGEIFIIYPHFVSTLRQESLVTKLLPIDTLIESEEIESNHILHSEFLMEPNAKQLLEYTLYHFLEIKVYQTMLETKASEHSARMIAMQIATNNAKELVSDLTLAYNQTRQEGITNELLEITSALAALE